LDFTGDGLNITLDEPLFPEQIDKPKALALGLYASYVFHDLILLIPRTHIHGAQAHVLLLICISVFCQQIIQDFPYRMKGLSVTEGSTFQTPQIPKGRLE
jgi:hypothetical protein